MSEKWCFLRVHAKSHEEVKGFWVMSQKTHKMRFSSCKLSPEC